MTIKRILIALVLLTTSFVLSGCDDKEKISQNLNLAPDQYTSASSLMSETVRKADKIEVVHFHATKQCWSCITVGKYAFKTIQEKFPEKYKDDTIVFKDINVELPKNRDMAMKYQASGSSLFVNAIADGQDNIEEDTRVWRLISDETQFMNYFENKLKNLLVR